MPNKLNSGDALGAKKIVRISGKLSVHFRIEEALFVRKKGKYNLRIN